MAEPLCRRETVRFHFHPSEESQLIKISTLLVPIKHPLIFHPTLALLPQLKSAPACINGPGRTTAHRITNATTFLPDSQEAICFMSTGLGGDLAPAAFSDSPLQQFALVFLYIFSYTGTKTINSQPVSFV